MSSSLDKLLGAMQAPPTGNKVRAEQEKRQREHARRQRAQLEKKLRVFEDKLWPDLRAHASSDKGSGILVFNPMPPEFREVIHEVASKFGLVGHSFGAEGVSRGVVVFRSSAAPTQQKLAALNRNLPYNQSLRDLEARRASDSRAHAERKAAYDNMRAEVAAAAAAATAIKRSASSRAEEEEDVSCGGDGGGQNGDGSRSGSHTLRAKRRALEKAMAATAPATSYGLGVSADQIADKRTTEQVMAELKRKREEAQKKKTGREKIK